VLRMKADWLQYGNESHLVPTDEFDKVLNINLKGYFLCAKVRIGPVIRCGGSLGLLLRSRKGLLIFRKGLLIFYRAPVADRLCLTRAYTKSSQSQHTWATPARKPLSVT
jgi:hypothetical protein